MKRKLFVSAIIALSFITLLNAQEGAPARDCWNFQPAYRAEAAQQILPLIKTQRIQLDKVISQKDKEKIESLRNEIESLYQLRLDEAKELRGKKDRPTLEQRQQMRAMRNQMNELMDEVYSIADNYDAAIIALLDEILPEIERIQTEFCPNRRSVERSNYRFRNSDETWQKPQQMGFRLAPEGKPHFYRMLTPEGFLLFDPAETKLMEDEFGKAPDLPVNIFPNPAGESTRVTVELSQNVPVTITLLDKDGIELSQISEDNADAGSFSVEIPLLDLEKGLYVLKIKAGEKTVVRRLIVGK